MFREPHTENGPASINTERRESTENRETEISATVTNFHGHPSKLDLSRRSSSRFCLPIARVGDERWRFQRVKRDLQRNILYNPLRFSSPLQQPRRGISWHVPLLLFNASFIISKLYLYLLLVPLDKFCWQVTIKCIYYEETYYNYISQRAFRTTQYSRYLR